MRAAHTVEQVRAAEHDLMARVPEGTLMQRAAHGLATAVADFLGSVYGARVVLLIGSGDNGGDALYAGARLARRGAQVTAVLLSDRAHEAGLAALLAGGGRVGTTDAIARADAVLDGIVGIGGRPGLKPEALAAVDVVERYGVPVVAVDVPSGVDVDTGATPERHVRADLTVTFGTHKICHLIDPAASACGPVHLVDIGLDLPEASVEALQPADVAALYPGPGQDAHKYTRGVVGLDVGSAQYPGAAVLAVAGALAGPAGIVRYEGPREVAQLILAAHPEIVTSDVHVRAWVFGSGHGREVNEDRIKELLRGDVPVLVDADGLRAVTERVHAPAVFTPHAGELSRMLDVPREQIEAERLRYARATAERFGATVLLKGSTTVIAAADGSVRVNTFATPWLGTAGSGDVLAGLCGALLAAGLDTFAAASVAAFLHGAAGRLASQGGPITAGDVAEKLAEATRWARGVDDKMSAAHDWMPLDRQAGGANRLV
jgi:hydroxyethylthiazole kinase-like uncharacterized protein yjeF